MSDKNDFMVVCSVSEMAKKLELSRARFYQLQNAGVFPKPIHDDHTKRPFYPLDLQQKCMETRKTGIGLNGKPVIFNAPRKNNKANVCSNGFDSEFNRFCSELVGVLKEFKLKLTRGKIKTALRQIRPDGLEQYSVTRELIHDLSEYFKERS
jgi:hypothetical protein